MKGKTQLKKLLLVCLGLLSLHVQANCPGRYFPDTGICQIQGNNGEVINYNSGTPNSGRGYSSQNTQSTYTPPQNSFAFFDQYGAIAFVNFDDGNGSHYKYISSSKKEITEDAAIGEALKACNKESKAFRKKNKTTCRAFYKYSNGCVALARGIDPADNQEVIHTMVVKDKNAVEDAAVQGCKKAGHKNCQLIRKAECSLGEIHSIVNGQYNVREVYDGEILHQVIPE